MPRILDPNKFKMPSENFTSVSYDYDYPLDSDGEMLKLKPGSKLHDDLVTKIMQRAIFSSNQMRNRFKSWKKIDEKMTGYILLDDDEDNIKDDDERKPVSIVFPHSYAILETMLAYMMAAFVQRPIFLYEGSGPEDIFGAMMLEIAIAQQCEHSKVALNLATMFSDAFKYGFSPVTPYWNREFGIRRRTVEETSSMFSFLTGRREQSVEEFEELLFEGNALANIDPYKYLPDPDVPIHKVQDGEFTGWVDETRYVSLLEEEKYSDGEMFNVQYVDHVPGRRTTVFSTDESGRHTRSKLHHSEDSTYIRPVDNINMYVNLIPKEWKLGTNEYPEKWFFTVSNDSVLIRANRVKMTHNKFPVAVVAPESDGYTLTPISRMEMLYPMQDMLDWMMNTHVANVRKAINDTLVVDPSLINMPDVKDPKPGGLYRLRKRAWGRGVKDAIMQLPVGDVTRGHVADSGLLANLMQTISGADESSMGSLRQGGPERLTAAEFRGTKVGNVSRFERIARMISLQGLTDVAYMFASHAQQFMSQETYGKTTGRWAATLAAEYGAQQNRILISPYELQIAYDVIAKDGSVPGGNFADVWTQLFQIIGTTPELLQSFDVTRIFKHIARDLGAKDVEHFERKEVNTQTLPDDVVDREAGRGNVVPLSAAGGVR